LSGKPLKGSPDGGTPGGGGSPNRDPLGGLPPDPPVGFYKWLAVDLRMFEPPWYPLITIRFEPTSKFPYQKLQYPTYVKDTNPNAHIKFFKKTIKANKEIVEVDIINMFGFTL